MPERADLDETALRSRLLRPGARWTAVDVVGEAGSTNADLAAAARAGAPVGSVLTADFQSAGRGRRGRTWTAPPGTNVALSVLVRPRVAAHRWTWLPLLTGLAVAGGLGAAAPVAARLKWPNDVLIGERKVCGILAERIETPSGPACVVGIGVNVGLAAADLPVPTATSLAVESAAGSSGGGWPVPSRTAVIAAVLAELDWRLAAWEAAADDRALAEAYADACATLGRRVRVLLGDGSTLEGDAESVDADGRLCVRTLAGLSVLGAGDVVHLRT